VQHSKINTMEQVDLFSFGHVAFEMQSTYSLQEPFVREINDCPLALSESIYSVDFFTFNFSFFSSIVQNNY
jgi:hypothetical protein